MGQHASNDFLRTDSRRESATRYLERETESDTDPRRFRPESGREGEGGRVVGDKMLGYTGQGSVRPIDSDRTILARTPKKPATREVARRKVMNTTCFL
jgi:hypothetical protein